MNIFLRAVTESDYPLIMAWRNSPLVWKGFYAQKTPLSWQEHLKWERSRNQDWRSFLVCTLEDDFERPIGLVNIGQLDHWAPEVGYLLGEPQLWDQGIGTAMVEMGIDWIKRYSLTHPHITGIHTTIKDDNTASIKLIKKLGFKKGMPARKGESYFYREL